MTVNLPFLASWPSLTSLSVQYNASLAITGYFRGTSKNKLYSELGLESLADRRFSRRLIFFYKIWNGLAPKYLSRYLPARNIALPNLRRRPTTLPIHIRNERYRNSFFPFCVTQWNALDSHIRNSPSISTFKSALLQFLKPKSNPTFKLGNNPGVVLLNRLRVDFSHLREHKFRHGFRDTVDPFCDCRTNSIETTEHFLLHCSNYSKCRTNLFNSLHNLSISIIPLSSVFLCRLLLYGDANFSDEINREILSIVIHFLQTTGRFDRPLF